MRSYYDDRTAIREAIHQFEVACDSYRSSRVERSLYSIITSDKFMRACFCPEFSKHGDSSREKEEMSTLLVQLYDQACKPKSVTAINEAISNFGYQRITRTPCVFLASVVNLGMANMNNKAIELGQRFDHGDISDAQYQKILGKLEVYQNQMWELMDHVKGALKRHARDVSRSTGLPKKVAYSALYTVPGPEYLDIYKLAFYMKAMLNNIYGFVDATDTWDFDEVRWTPFFREIFGKSRLVDAASALLVEENVRDLTPYKQNPDAVEACMRSLTNWALSTLNRAPEDTRDHMIELYLKRIGLVLKDSGVNVRLDLRDIDNIRFADLARTIGRYADKFAKLVR